jgi:hypothetical protein
MKTRLILWLSIELIVASGISAASCILRHDEAKAFGAWYDKPSIETKSELDRQRRITRWHQVAFAGVLFSGMAVLTVPVVYLVSRRQQRTEPINS